MEHTEVVISGENPVRGTELKTIEHLLNGCCGKIDLSAADSLPLLLASIFKAYS